MPNPTDRALSAGLRVLVAVETCDHRTTSQQIANVADTTARHLRRIVAAGYIEHGPVVHYRCWWRLTERGRRILAHGGAERVTCEVCGIRYEREAFVRGRTRRYCSSTCRRKAKTILAEMSHAAE